MNGWMTLWTIVLLGALTLFTGLSITVTFGALVDLRKMFRQLRPENKPETQD